MVRTLIWLAVSACAVPLLAGQATGPLRVHPENPRYFTDGSGRAIYLTGSHTWAGLVDLGPSDPPPAFDFAGYLDWLARYRHNFIRLWTWELSSWDTRANPAGHRTKNPVHTSAPHPWARSGPENALDGKPQFDLDKPNPEYFKRLRNHVVEAGRRGIYVGVMLFEGWGIRESDRAFEGHPFHPRNNVNGINGDVDGDGKAIEIHTLANPKVTAVQEAYVRRVVDAINDLDNVLYEIANEADPSSTEWQYHMIGFVKRYQKSKPKQHPVGMTVQKRKGSNQVLFDSPADWISPDVTGGYRADPPASRGEKVILNDTDHLWGIGGREEWVWMSFVRGLNPIFMDPYDGIVLGQTFDPRWEPVRRAMGHTRAYAERVNLAKMMPRADLSSTGYCLANPGVEYIVFLPKGGAATVDLSGVAGDVSVEWFVPSTGITYPPVRVAGGREARFDAPFSGSAVLYLNAAGGKSVPGVSRALPSQAEPVHHQQPD
jgi:hypothetical protein